MRPAVAAPAAAGFYVVLAIAITWPLVLHPGSVVPNDLGDPLLNTWLMAWNARVLPLTAAWWNTPQFFPDSMGRWRFPSTCSGCRSSRRP